LRSFDFLATAPKTAAEIAAQIQTADIDRVERLMYALVSEGVTKLVIDKQDGSKRFVNIAFSATLRRITPIRLLDL